MLAKILKANEFYLVLIILVVAAIIEVRSGQFFTLTNIVNLANAMVVPGLFAVGTYMVLVSGGIDVSFPALASLAVYALTSGLVDNGWAGGIWLPFLLAIVLGGLLGAFNGAFAARLAIPTLIITLGTANVFKGLMQGALGSVQIPTLPPSMAEFGRATLFVARNPQTGLTSSMPVSSTLR